MHTDKTKDVFVVHRYPSLAKSSLTIGGDVA
jgi:hypothetical protein